MEIGDAVNKAIAELRPGIVKSYLELHKSEVADMMLSEYDEAEAMNLFYRDGYVEGEAKGLEKGEAIGLEKGKSQEKEKNKQISKLYYGEHLQPSEIALRLSIDLSEVEDFIS